MTQGSLALRTCHLPLFSGDLVKIGSAGIHIGCRHKGTGSSQNRRLSE